MAHAFACPQCGASVLFPSRTCEKGCSPYVEFFVPSTTGEGLQKARETSTQLVKAIGRLQGTSAYDEAMAHGASSGLMQKLITPSLIGLGYVDERKKRSGLAGFKPDFILEVPGDSVLVEVERGKTIDNNMDMLDLWKCHILEGARHLVLLVPIWYVKQKRTGGESRTATYSRVCVRLSQFFELGNYTNVRSLHLIGY